MVAPVVLDSGPLVALLDRHDPFHAWADAQADLLHEPMLTCEAVLSESTFLLQGVDPGYRRLTSLVREGFVRLEFDVNDHFEAIANLMVKYHDVPMSLADACIVRMSELHYRARVFTIDSDFKRYRRHSRQAIPLIFPDP